MSKADGTVTFSAEFDNKELAAQVDEATKKVESIEGKIKTLEKDRASAVREAERAQKQLTKEQEAYNAAMDKSVAAGEQAAEAKKALLDAQQKLKDIEQKKLQPDAVLSGQIESTPGQYIRAKEKSEQLSADLKNQQAEVQKLTKEWQTAQSAMERCDAALADAQAKVDSAVEGARNAQAAVSGFDANLEAANAELASATAKAGDLSAKFQQAERKAASLRKPIDAASAAINRFGKRLKRLVLNAFIFTIIAKGLRALKERLTDAISESEEASRAIANLKGAANTAAQPIINMLVPALTSLAQALTRCIVLAGSLFGTDFSTNSIDAAKALDKVNRSAKEANKTIGGFDELNVMSNDSQNGSSYEFDDVITGEAAASAEKLNKLVSEAALAIGAILCFSGAHIGLGIALMAFGAISLVSEIKEDWSSTENKVMGAADALFILLSGAMFVIGAILAFSGNIPLGVAMMIEGAAVAELAINWNSLEEELKTPLGSVGGVLVGAALVALGILLCCTGGAMPLGIGLIAAGAGALASTISVNWNGIVDALQTPLGEAVTLIGGVILIVLGIILLCTGVGIPLGIGLIAAGAGFIAAPIAANWGYIKDKVKEIWQSVKDFWNQHIAPVFTAQWWKNLAIKCANGLISGFESAINGIISAFESMINWIVNGLNKISFDIPDWVPSIGGKTFGFSIQEVKFGRVSIPRLAQGAVLPANEPFMAVVGDQKHGTNVEAPLETIQDAVNAVMAERDERMIAVLLQLVGVAERIEQKDTSVTIGDETIGRANDRYVQNRGVRVNSGAFSNAY